MARKSKPRAVRMSFEGPMEDQPRLIRAYVRTRREEVALVLRPGAQSGLLVRTAAGEAEIWKANGPMRDPALVEAPALILRESRGTVVRIQDGAHVGAELEPDRTLSDVIEHGAEVTALFRPGASSAIVLGPGAGGDAPLRPTQKMTAVQAVKLVKQAQKGVPKAGPITLRGRWTGTFTWHPTGVPEVHLRRKLASYGTLHIRSHEHAGWSWRFEREARWFAPEAAESQGDELPTLSQAIEAGLFGARMLVRPACAVRDTERRAARDGAYAKKRPIPKSRSMRNPLADLEQPGRKAAAGKKGKRKPARGKPGSSRGGSKRAMSAKGPDALPTFDRMPKKRTESMEDYARRLLSEARTRVEEGHHRVAAQLLERAELVRDRVPSDRRNLVNKRIEYVRGRVEEAKKPRKPAAAKSSEPPDDPMARRADEKPLFYARRLLGEARNRLDEGNPSGATQLIQRAKAVRDELAGSPRGSITRRINELERLAAGPAGVDAALLLAFKNALDGALEDGDQVRSEGRGK